MNLTMFTSRGAVATAKDLGKPRVYISQPLFVVCGLQYYTEAHGDAWVFASESDDMMTGRRENPTVQRSNKIMTDLL